MADAMLEATAMARGEEKAAISREIIEEWARQQARFMIQAERRLAAYGLEGDLRGYAGRFAARKTVEDGADD